MRRTASSQHKQLRPGVKGQKKLFVYSLSVVYFQNGKFKKEHSFSDSNVFAMVRKPSLCNKAKENKSLGLNNAIKRCTFHTNSWGWETGDKDNLNPRSLCVHSVCSLAKGTMQSSGFHLSKRATGHTEILQYGRAK